MRHRSFAGKKRFFVQFSLLIAALMLLMGHSPVNAQTYPTQIGVEADCRGVGPYVDMAKTLRQFTTIGTGTATPMDANGWPTTDGETVLIDDRPLPAWAPPLDDPAGYQPDESGVYNCSFLGQATLATSGGSPITFANQSYNAGTNTTTFTFTLPAGTWQTAPALIVIDFTNTKRTAASGTNTGITNLVAIRPGYPAGSTQVYTNQFTSAFAPFDHVRYMDFMDTNFAAGFYGDPGHHVINWADRGLPSDATQGLTALHPGAYGNAWEYVILLANQLNKDPWINIPISASGFNTTDTTSYIYQLALLFKNGDAATGGVGLKPGLHLYIEHSNEVWNFGFSQYTWNKSEAIDAVAGTGPLGTTHINSDGSTDQEVWAHRRHGERLYQIAQIFKTVFGAGSLNTTIRPIYASWFIQSQSHFSDVLTWMNTQYGAPNTYFYAMAGAAYAGETPTAGESVATILANMTASSNANVANQQALRTVANNFGLKLFGYEGGPDNGGGSTTNVGNRILANRDPGMTTLIEHDIRNNYFIAGGGDSYNFFSLSSGYSRYGCWGLSDDISNTGAGSVKWAAIYNITGYNPGGAPAAPSNLTATSGNTQITLNWTASSGATSYSIYRGTAAGGESTTAIATGVSVTTYTNTGLANGTAYYYTVKAVNASGTSGASNEASATPSAPSAPPAPTGLTATAGNSQVSLTWNASSGATSYNVLRSTVNGSGYASVVTGLAVTNYTNTGLANGTTYYFVVTATNSIGTSGNSNQASATPSVGSQNTLGDTDDRDSQSDVPAGTNPIISASCCDQSYFKFSLSTISGTVTNAKLRVYRPEISQGTITFNVHQTLNDTWVQSGTVPGLGSTILSVGNGAVGYIEWDVTTYVVGQMGGDKIASFGVDSSASGYTNLNTRESASNQPQLVITTNGGSIPAAPAGLTATPGNTQVALSWTASTGATSYNVKRSTVNGSGYVTVSSPTTTSYTNTGLTNGTTYYFVVTAVNSSGESGNSNQASAIPQVPAPPAPTNLTATPGNAQVVLNWTASAGATSYTVNFTTGGNYTVAGNPATTTFTHTGLTNGTLYTYYVTATNAGGTSGASGTANATPVAIPAPPTGLTATAGNTQVALSWTASSGATAYDVKRSTVSGSGYTAVSSPTVTNYTNTGLTNGTTYYFVVDAKNASGTSANSAQASATPQISAPAAPTGLTATPGNAQVVLSWTASSGATTYSVLRSTVSGSGYASVATGIAVTTYTNTGLTNGTAYYFVVTATNAGGTSPNSAQASATPSAGGGVTTLGDTDDRDSQSDVVAGTNPTISVSQYDQSYFKFTVSGITGTVTNAKLRLYRSDVNLGSVTYNIYRTLNDTWVQSGTVPGLGTLITSTVNGAIGYVEFDVTSFVAGQITGDGIASFGMDSSATSYTNFSTRENASNQPQLVITTSGGSIPPVPTGLIATPGNTQVALSWSASTGATAYDVKRGTVSGSGYVTVSSPTVTNYTNTGLTNGTTYYFVVDAKNTSGTSANSAQVSAVPAGIPAAPTGLTATNGNTQVALSWTASGGATSYNVKRSTVSGSGYVTVSSPTTTSYTNTGLTNGTTYYFVVTAINASGESGNSNQASGTPYAIAIAPGTATIDGTVDAAWSSATAYTMANNIAGTAVPAADISGTFKALWDTTNLYVLFQITDDVKVNDSTNPWDDDAVEVFIDGNYSHGSTYDNVDDVQYTFGWGDSTFTTSGITGHNAGIVFAKADPTGTTYVIEIKIPWSTTGGTASAGRIIGFDGHVDDDDDGAARDNALAYSDTNNTAWSTPSVFAAARLN